ncbi:MAG TPA: helix-turn-helix domain-containing protein [Caulobacteraceae bacterium]
MAQLQSGFPSFFLYGEAPREVSERFLHLEDLDHRSRPSHWNIRAHAHSDLNHIFLLTQGAGEMNADGQSIPFAAPCLLTVPAGVIHGFVYEPETAGSVLTLAGGYLRELIGREDAFRGLFEQPAQLSLDDPQPVSDAYGRLGRELAWTAPGHVAAVEAHLMTILVEALRLIWQAGAAAPVASGSALRLVARFREAVEAGYRAGATIDAYAQHLCVTTTKLRRACLAAAGCSPIGIVQARLLLEAKRALLYTNMTVAETAYYLGFDDPAYFSRFFTQQEGVSPKAFRNGERS